MSPIVSVLLERVAGVPAAGVLNEMTPPATGSSGLFAVTVTISGFAKAVPVAAVCDVLPAIGTSVNPWLWKAPMSGWRRIRGIPRWSVVMPLTGVPAPMRQAAGQEGDRFRRAAVVAQRGEERVGHTHDVPVAAVHQAARAAGADQVVGAL